MKDKYTTYVLPRLVEVLDWARAGAGLKEIAARLGVSTTRERLSVATAKRNNR